MEWGPVKSGLILKIKPNFQGSRFSPTRDAQKRIRLWLLVETPYGGGCSAVA